MIYPPKRDSAVSPVIGTILLVAITVVLVAIIGAVVMSLADAEDGKKVGMNAQPADKNTAKLILYGGESLSDLVKLEMIDQDSPYGKYVELWNITSSAINVGIPYPAYEVAQPERAMAIYETRINVKGTFSDGREVILLVQPMTFYDVVISSSAPIRPIINKPTVSAPSITFNSAEITVSYVNLTSAPSERGIYYQPKNGGAVQYKSVGSGGGLNDSFKVVPDDLLPGTEYYVWGHVKSSGDGAVTGTEKEVFTTDKPTMEITGLTARVGYSGQPGGLHIHRIIVQYSYTNDSVISSGKIYYRIVESGKPYDSVDMNLSSKSITILDLHQNTTYEVYGEITTASGTYNSTIGTTKTSKMSVGKPFVYSGIISSTSAKLEFSVTYPEVSKENLKGWIYYRVADTNDVPKKVSIPAYTLNRMITLYQPLTGLTPETKYETWGSMLLLNGEELWSDPSTFTTPA